MINEKGHFTLIFIGEKELLKTRLILFILNEFTV